MSEGILRVKGLSVSLKIAIVVNIKGRIFEGGAFVMKWTEKCILNLAHHNLFENDGHRHRFYDLLDCYFDKPFFTKGLCKCMYLSAWDTEHFSMMLETLNATLIEHDFCLHLMRDQGQIEQAEAHAEHNLEAEEIWKLVNAFVSGRPYDSSSLSDVEIRYPETAYMIKRALLASKIIDELPSLNLPSSDASSASVLSDNRLF